MKNLFKLSAVLAVVVLTLSGCNCFKKMAKNQDDVKLTCTPEVLVLNNGKVVADITAEVPAKYFNKKAALKVTPAIVYAGGVTKGNTLLLQGEKIADNGMSDVENLFVAGEAVGGIHGENRLMGNSLLDIIVFGRNAGIHAAEAAKNTELGALTLDHIAAFEKEIADAGIETTAVSPKLLPNYTKQPNI